MNIHFARPLEVGRPSNLVPRPSLASTFSCNIIPLTYSTLLDTWFNLFSTHHKTQQSRVKLAGSDRWLLLVDYAFVELFGNWLNLSTLILNLRLHSRMGAKAWYEDTLSLGQWLEGRNPVPQPILAAKFSCNMSYYSNNWYLIGSLQSSAFV